MLAFLVLAGLATASGWSSRGTVQQPLNHSRHDSETFAQRFLVNDTFRAGASAPVFLMVGGENDIETWASILGGQVFDLAQQFGASVVALEHRGFGMSTLVGDSLADLSALSVGQAVRDVFSFYDQAVGHLGLAPRDAPWVAFGCSYSGLVAAFAAQPEGGGRGGVGRASPLAGVVASSAPLRAQTRFDNYTNALMLAMADPAAGGSARCGAAVQASLAAGAALVAEGTRGWEELAAGWGFCSAPTSLIDAQWAWRFVTEYTLGFQFVQESRGGIISYACAKALGAGPAALAPVAAILNVSSQGQCVDAAPLADFVRELRNTTVAPSESARQYTWLKCTELGWFHTCDAPDGCTAAGAAPAAGGGPLPLSLFQTLCMDALGIGPGAQAAAGAALNERFGGTAPPGREDGRVQYVTGDADPWRFLGADPQASFSPPVVRVEGGWHCSDMDPLSLYTPAPVRAARASVRASVARFLSSP